MPVPPMITSSPAPASTESSLLPASMVSLPEPVTMVSLPSLPAMLSPPLPAVIESLPMPPVMTSAPLPATMVSFPSLPSMWSTPSLPITESSPTPGLSVSATVLATPEVSMTSLPSVSSSVSLVMKVGTETTVTVSLPMSGWMSIVSAPEMFWVVSELLIVTSIELGSLPFTWMVIVSSPAVPEMSWVPASSLRFSRFSMMGLMATARRSRFFMMRSPRSDSIGTRGPK